MADIPADGVADRPRAERWTGYQIWVLGLLTIIGITSFIDRSVLAILQESIKHELKLTDFQLGLLSGPATVVLYALVGLPIARLAERANRTVIVAVALTTWSTMTAACGLMVNYTQLLLCRVGVGVGDAGCTAPIHSIIGDYFATRQRGPAMAIYNTCIPIGLFFGALLGGNLARHFGWRVAFIAVGLPGIALAVIAKLTLKEPARGQSETAIEASRDQTVPTTGQAFAYIARNPAFIQLVIGGSLIGFAVYGVNFFTASFFLRRFGLSLPQVATITALGQGAAGLFGTLLGGFLAHRFESRSGASYPMVCAGGAVFSGIFFILAFCIGDWRVAAAVMIFANIGVAMKNGPAFAAVLNIVPPRMRATAASVNLLCISLLGGALGPMSVGAISDAVAAHVFPAALGPYHHLCAGGRAIPGSTIQAVAACTHASTAGIQAAVIVASCVFFWSAVHYALSARSIGRFWRA